MKAVTIPRRGGPEVLEVVDCPAPAPAAGEVLVRVFASALNRADLLQRRGLYPPPPGVTDIPGLEFAGEVAEVGPEVSGFDVGDPVFGLLPGGGHAELVAVPADTCLPVPETMSYDAAAAVPEAFFTARETLVGLAELREGETVLVHAGASGVGSAAIQLARSLGARVFATVGSADKAVLCEDLGVERAILRREEDFSSVVLELVPDGVDVVLDLVGAKYWTDNQRALAIGGRHLVVGLVGGALAEVDLAALIRKRVRVLATNLRSRDADERVRMATDFRREVLPLLESGEIRPVLDQVFPLEDVRAAHERMEANLNLGKIVLRF